MPLYQHIKTLNDADIHIWKIDEPADYFLNAISWEEQQINWLNTIHPAKRLEYLASRFLIFEVAGILDSHLYKNEAGKIYFKSKQQHLSISHSSNYTAVALSKKTIGFDLQCFSEKIFRVAQRFLSKQESIAIKPFESIHSLTTAWTIKEAVYKAYGQKGIHFNKQILINMSTPFEGIQKTNATLINNQIETHYDIFSQIHSDFSWSLAQEV